MSMDSQNIKRALKKPMVVDIIKDICIQHSMNNIYTFDNDCYKRMRLFKKVEQIIKLLKPYYYESKQYYLTRKMNYKTFCTIIRQICKHVKIKIVSNIKYIHSSYLIHYNIIL